MREGLELLAQLRASRAEWKRIEFNPTGELGRDRSDQNAAQRRHLAWALQRDYQQGDAELARFALAHEVSWREEDPWQGIGESLEILAGLVALQRRVENVWSLARAKRANFDTGCGFSIEYAFAAGVRSTLAYVSQSDHSDREETLAVLTDDDGGPRVDEDDVARWLSREWWSLPVEPAANADVWFDRALSLGMKDAARAFLHDWVRASEGTSGMSSALAYRLEELECWREASAARRENFEQLLDPFQQASEACAIAHAERKSGDSQEALRWLNIAAGFHLEHADWSELGLARSFVEECFRCAASEGFEEARRAFALADRFAKVTPRLPLLALRAAVDAAQAIQSSRSAHYERLLAREEERVAQELSRLEADSEED